MYALIEHNTLTEWPIVNLRQRLPQVSFREVIDNNNLPEGFVFIEPAVVPNYNSETHEVNLNDPKLVGDTWIQAYTVSPLSAEEIARRRKMTVPSEVNMRQARAALITAGYMNAVNEALASMPGVEGEIARSNWEYAAVVDRNNSLTEILASVLDLTELQVDDLFIIAEKL
jgi:hypothetical protein